VGFAVPIVADTRRIIDRLKKGEEVVYGYLGIEIADVSEDQAQAADIDVGTGAYLTKILPGTPAAKAGLKEGDIILSVNEAAVRGSDDVIQVVQAIPVGERVTLSILRGGKPQKIAAEVARRPGVDEMASGAAPRDTPASWRGMSLEPLTEELRTQTALKVNDRGAFVKEVKDGSPAASAGIVPGMVIDQVGEKRIASVREFTAAVTSATGAVTVHIIGLGTKTIQATAKPPETKTAPTDTKAAPDKSKGKSPPTKPSVTPTDKPAATPTATKGADKPAPTPTAAKSGSDGK